MLDGHSIHWPKSHWTNHGCERRTDGYANVGPTSACYLGCWLMKVIHWWHWSGCVGVQCHGLIIGCQQWATDGLPVNLIVGCQQWTTVYQLVMPLENHHKKIYGTQQWATGGSPVNLVGYWRWATGGPIEKLIIGCRQIPEQDISILAQREGAVTKQFKYLN